MYNKNRLSKAVRIQNIWKAVFVSKYEPYSKSGQ